MAWAENITFVSQGFALNIPKWDFPDEGVTCVWGASGSGKSTLLQILAGLIECKNFHLFVGGEPISDLPARQRNIGFVFQDFALFPHMTAWENIIFAAQAKNLDPTIWTAHAEDLLRRLGLDRVRNSKAQVLSGGEQQRVALARALVTKPRLVLLDEPLSSLDEKIRFEARSLIFQLSKEFLVPFIFVTHDLRDVRAGSKSLMVLSEGKCVGAGPVKELLARPPNLELARLLPENQVLKIENRNGKYFLAEMEVSDSIFRVKSDLAQTALVAKKWSFQISNTKENLKGEVVDVTDEGLHRVCKLKLKDGQFVQAWTALDLDLIQGDMDLKVDEKSLILFKEGV